MEKIPTNVSSYITVAGKTIEELIKVIDHSSFTTANLQVNINNAPVAPLSYNLYEPHIFHSTPFYLNKGSLCNRLKILLPAHLEDDIIRFAGGPHIPKQKKANNITNLLEAVYFTPIEKIRLMMSVKKQSLGVLLKEGSGGRMERSAVEPLSMNLLTVKSTRDALLAQIETTATTIL
ncbi:hypothetical protein BDF21DRAFT_398172 [Thamnidium elegans]|nr:hypothetical protein BDF21DRAFT_398172 [Thamnidium elegans]